MTSSRRAMDCSHKYFNRKAELYRIESQNSKSLVNNRSISHTHSKLRSSLVRTHERGEALPSLLPYKEATLYPRTARRLALGMSQLRRVVPTWEPPWRSFWGLSRGLQDQFYIFRNIIIRFVSLVHSQNSCFKLTL